MVSGDNVVCPVIEPLAVWSIGLYGYIYNAVAQHRPRTAASKQVIAA